MVDALTLVRRHLIEVLARVEGVLVKLTKGRMGIRQRRTVAMEAKDPFFGILYSPGHHISSGDDESFGRANHSP